MVTITRKVQILFDISDKSELKDLYAKLYGWQRICHRAANYIATHQFIQENVKDIFYFEDGTKKKLANVSADADGILNTSSTNTTYQLLSKAFKGEAPMGMLSGLNTNIVKTFKKEAIDVKNGKKSLRSYRENIPMPVRWADVSNITKLSDDNYSIRVYGVSFKTNFGRDKSGNQIMFDRCVAGEYKFCDSSIQLDGNKIFLLAAMQFDQLKTALDKDKNCIAELDIAVPIKLLIDKKEFTIGTADEFLYRRLAIQGALRRTQAASRFNIGGKGREKKMQAIDRYHKAEDNYVDTRIHQYTAKLVDYCKKFKCGNLILRNQLVKQDEAKEDEQFLLRNWTYFGMTEKLKYKCNKYGINLVIE